MRELPKLCDGVYCRTFVVPAVNGWAIFTLVVRKRLGYFHPRPSRKRPGYFHPRRPSGKPVGYFEQQESFATLDPTV